MPLTRSSLVLSLVMSLAPLPVGAGWSPEGNPVTSLAGFKAIWQAIPDREGGVYVLWDGAGLRLQRMLKGGDIAPGWPVDGIRVSFDALDYGHSARMCLDSQGGVIILMEDHRNSVGQNYSDIFATRITSDGRLAAGWPAAGLPVCVVLTQEFSPRIIADGLGGYFLAWHDTRPLGGPPSDGAYMTRLLENGTFDSRWPVNGLSIGSLDTYEAPVLTSDGTGGVFVTRPLRVGIQVSRLQANGMAAPGWTLSGVPVSPSGIRPHAAADGAGGLFIAWMDGRSFSTSRWDIRASRFLPGGALAPGWLPTGTVVGVTQGEQYNPDVISDGEGGAYIAWSNNACWPNCSSYIAFAARLNGDGQPAPGWTPAGRPFREDFSGNSPECRLLSDGNGGFFGGSVTSGHVHAQRVTPHGETADTWPPDGRFINVPHLHPRPAIALFAEDDREGFYSAWIVNENQILVQRTTSDGRICGHENQPPTHSLEKAGSTVRVTAGESFELPWTFSDPDGNGEELIVELLSSLPGFVSLSPALPTSGSTVSLVLRGTPAPGDAGRYEIDAGARDRCDASVIGRLEIVVNRPPDCSSAVAILGNGARGSRDFTPVSISGLVDPDGDSLAIRVTEIHQDEDPSRASSPTCPDARVTDGEAEVRIERDGGGDGRVYHLSFTATDEHGAACTGVARLCIPHDQGKQSACEDGGPIFESMACAESRDSMVRPGISERVRLERTSSNALTLTLDSPTGQETRIDLYDISGRPVAGWQRTLSSGRNVVRLDSGRLASGLYFMRVQPGNGPVKVLRHLHVAE